MCDSRTGPKRLVPVGFLIALGCFTAPIAHADTIRLTTQDWPPYQIVTEGRPLTGTAVQTVKCILSIMGVHYTIEALPGFQAQEMVRDSEADAFFTVIQGEEEDAYAVLSEPIAFQSWRWYLPIGSNKEVTDRTRLRVGVQTGTALQQWLEDNGYNVAVHLSSPLDLINDLRAGRIDAVLGNEFVFGRELKRMGENSGLKTQFHSDRPLSVYFSREFLSIRPGFLSWFNGHIPRCR